MFNLMVKPIRYILTHKQVILKVILLLLLLGGIYEAVATYHDYINDVDITKSKDIQILTKEAIQIEQGKTFLWIFYKDYVDERIDPTDQSDLGYRGLKLKDIVEIDNYEVVIDEETNGTSTFEVLKDTQAESGDIVVFKKDEDILYWGIIDEITNENGGIKYTYQCKYITNIFNQKLPMPYSLDIDTFGLQFFLREGWVQLAFQQNPDLCLTPDEDGNIILSKDTKQANQYWYMTFSSESATYGTGMTILNLETGKYLSTSGTNNSQLFLSDTAYTWGLDIGGSQNPRRAIHI